MLDETYPLPAVQQADDAENEEILGCNEQLSHNSFLKRIAQSCQHKNCHKPEPTTALTARVVHRFQITAIGFSEFRRFEYSRSLIVQLLQTAIRAEMQRICCQPSLSLMALDVRLVPATGQERSCALINELGFVAHGWLTPIGQALFTEVNDATSIRLRPARRPDLRFPISHRRPTGKKRTTDVLFDHLYGDPHS